MTKQSGPTPAPTDTGQRVRDRTADAASTPRRILLVDDNAAVAATMSVALAAAGYALDAAASPELAHSLLARRRYDAILLDLNFGPGRINGAEGLACLDRILADDPHAAVLVLTAHSGVRVAVAAMRAGAVDFVMKPWSNADLVARIAAVVARSGGRTPSRGADPAGDAGPLRLLGEHPAIAQARRLIRRIADTGASAAVIGLPGTGRSLVAQLIHDASQVSGPAETIDLRDAAAWGALVAPTGRLVLRHPDALDDVTQERLVRGLPRDVPLLGILADPGKLNARLRARLGPVELMLPPLEERGADALILARHFAAGAAARLGLAPPVLTATAEAAVLGARWPDQIHGLRRAVERAAILDDTGVIDAAALAPRLVETVAAAAPARAAPLDVSLVNAERVMIEDALKRHGHNVAKAADALGLSRQALYRRMVRHGL